MLLQNGQAAAIAGNRAATNAMTWRMRSDWNVRLALMASSMPLPHGLAIEMVDRQGFAVGIEQRVIGNRHRPRSITDGA